MGAAVDFMQSAGGGNIASQALQTITNVFMAAKQHKRQKELLRMQQDYQTKERKESQNWQRDMWQHQFDSTNRYNAPAAQMARYVEAGLNPDLMYSQNGVQGAMMGSVPGPTASGAPAVPQPAGDELLAQAGQGIGDLALKVAEWRNLEANTNKQNKESENIEQDTKNAKVLNTLYGKQIVLSDDMHNINEQELKNMQAELNNLLEYGNQMKSITNLNIQELYEAKATFKQRMQSIILHNEQMDIKNKVDAATLNHIEEFIEASMDIMIEQANYYQKQSLQTAAVTIDINKLNEAKRKFKANLNGKEAAYYDIITALQIAALTGDNAMLQENLRLLKSYGGYRAVVEPAALVLGAAAGSFISNTVPVTGIKSKPMKPIGFNSSR